MVPSPPEELDSRLCMMRPVATTALTCENTQSCCYFNFDTVSEQHMPASVIITSLLRVFVGKQKPKSCTAGMLRCVYLISLAALYRTGPKSKTSARDGYNVSDYIYVCAARLMTQDASLIQGKHDCSMTLISMAPMLFRAYHDLLHVCICIMGACAELQ